MPVTKKLAVLLAALPLAGCISFGGKPPEALLAIRAAESLPAGTTRSSASAPTITVATPEVPQELANTRVPVRSSETRLAYVKDAQWVEQPGRMFARLLGDTLSARTGRVVLRPRQALADPGALLTGTLQSFGIDARTREAVVIYEASLVRGRDAGTFETNRFEARVPVTAIEPQPVAEALNAAANQVAAEVADWVGR